MVSSASASHRNISNVDAHPTLFPTEDEFIDDFAKHFGEADGVGDWKHLKGLEGRGNSQLKVKK